MTRPLKNHLLVYPRGSLQLICGTIKLPGAQAVFLKCDPQMTYIHITVSPDKHADSESHTKLTE